MNPKKTLFFLTIFLCGVFSIGLASLSNTEQGDGFLERYRQYQGYVKAGYASVNKRQYGAAINHYSKAIEVSPFVASHYYYGGLAWYKKGKEAKALEDFDKVIMLDSRWSSAYLYRGLCRMKRGEFKEALGDYNRALNLKPKNASIHNNLAWLYATANDEKFQDESKALEHARKAAELSNESNAEILDTLARAYFINGKVKEAIEAEKKALKLAADSDTFKEHLRVYGGQQKMSILVLLVPLVM